MKTIYPTTKPGWHDTKAIAKGKWAQQLISPSTVKAGSIDPITDTTPRKGDGQLRTIQKILAIQQTITGIQESLAVGLISHWPLNDEHYLDVVGSNMMSASGNPGLAAGKVSANAMLCVPGSNDYLGIESNATLVATGDFSFSGWLYVTDWGGAPYTNGILGKWSDGSEEYLLYADGTGVLRSVGSSDGSTNDEGGASPALAINTWHFFTWTYQRSTKTFTLTVNSPADNIYTHTLAGDIFEGTSYFFIATYQEPAFTYHNYKGRLESFSMWNRVLTAAEKLYLWNNGNGRAYPF